MTDQKASSWSHAVEAAIDAAFAPIHAGVDRLIAERAELLAALKELHHASPASGWEQLNAHKRAAEVIAKYEGR
jgi:hypothetical protein